MRAKSFQAASGALGLKRGLVATKNTSRQHARSEGEKGKRSKGTMTCPDIEAQS